MSEQPKFEYKGIELDRPPQVEIIPALSREEIDKLREEAGLAGHIGVRTFIEVNISNGHGKPVSVARRAPGVYGDIRSS